MRRYSASFPQGLPPDFEAPVEQDDATIPRVDAIEATIAGGYRRAMTLAFPGELVEITTRTVI